MTAWKHRSLVFISLFKRAELLLRHWWRAGAALRSVLRTQSKMCPRFAAVRGEVRDNRAIRGGERRAGWNLAPSLPQPPPGL